MMCPVEYTLKVLGSKWTVLIIRDLFTGTKRFGQLQRSLKGVSPKTLKARLRELEAEGIITCQVFAEVPPRVEYTLTERGQSLRPILQSMVAWGTTGDPNLSQNAS